MLALLSISAYTQNFQPGSTVEIGSGMGYNHPQLVLNSGEAPMVLWTDAASKNCYLALQNDLGAFDNPVQLNPTGFDVQSYNWSGPDLARWEQNVYVVFKAEGYETGHIYLVKSTDDGLTFGDTVRVDNLNEGFAQYPDVAVYNDTVFVTFMAHDNMGMNPQYVVARSTNGGVSFEPAVAAGSLTGNEACDCCQPEIIVNDKVLMVLFRNNNANIRDIKGVISYNRGASFSQFFSVDDHNWLQTSCPSTGPDTYLNGNTLFTAYKTEEAGDPKVILNQFDVQNMQSIADFDLGFSLSGVVNYPQIAGSGDTLGVVFEGFDVAGDIFFIPSYNGLSGLDIQNRINLTALSGSQNKPDVAFASGKFHVVYNDLSQLKYVLLNPVVGLNELSPESKNPTVVYSKSNTASIKTNQTGKCELINLQGQRTSINTDNSGEISIQNLAPGSYFLHIQNGNQQATQQIIITP